jgi:hypothetical protein
MIEPNSEQVPEAGVIHIGGDTEMKPVISGRRIREVAFWIKHKREPTQQCLELLFIDYQVISAGAASTIHGMVVLFTPPASGQRHGGWYAYRKTRSC